MVVRWRRWTNVVMGAAGGDEGGMGFYSLALWSFLPTIL